MQEVLIIGIRVVIEIALKKTKKNIVGIKKGFYICTRLRNKRFKKREKSSLTYWIDSVRILLETIEFKQENKPFWVLIRIPISC